MWICFSNQELKYIRNLKEEFDAAVGCSIPIQCKLDQGISMFVDIHKDPIVISFKKSTIRINISPVERPQLMKVILQGKADHRGTKFKRQCTT